MFLAIFQKMFRTNAQQLCVLNVSINRRMAQNSFKSEFHAIKYFVHNLINIFFRIENQLKNMICITRDRYTAIFTDKKCSQFFEF